MRPTHNSQSSNYSKNDTTGRSRSKRRVSFFFGCIAVALLSFGLYVVLAADQFFAGDGSPLSAAKWGTTSVGPFTSSFTNGNVANFAAVNGTGTGGTITVGGINATENFTITSASGTLGGTAGVVNPITVSSDKTFDAGSQNWSSGATVGFSMNGPGILGLAGNTFAGGFVLNSGTVVARGVNAMGAGSSLTINGGTIAGSVSRDFTGKYPSGITAGGNYQLGALSTDVLISLSTANLTFSNNVALGAATRTITIGGNGIYTLGGIISGNAGTGLTVANGPGATGILTLNGVNTYSGDTTINSGKLSLGTTGSFANSPNIVLAGGANLDVSTLTIPLTLASGQALQASGTTTTGTIVTAATRGLITAADSPLQFTAFNSVTPPLTVSGPGTLALQSGNPTTVTVANGGTPLGVGDYKLIAKGTGTVTGTPTALVVNGDGIENGMSASLQLASGELFLHVEPSAPTEVKLIAFKALENNGEVTLQWQSGYEARNLGYNIYREQDGKLVAITPSLIAGSALVAGRQTKLSAGLGYTWYDRLETDQQFAIGNPRSPVTYWLEDVDLNGTRTLHGPIVPEISNTKQRGREPRADLMSEVSRRTAVNGVQFNSWPAESGDQRSGQQTTRPSTNNLESSVRIHTSDAQRDIAGMPGVKIGISKPGWYRVTQTELAAAAFTVQDAKQLQLYRNGREVSISLSNSGYTFTPNDYLEFYGEGLDSPTETVQTYYLVNGKGQGKRLVATNAGGKPNEPVASQSFAYTVERRERMIYFSGLRNGDQENFFGQIVSMDPVSVTVPVSHLDAASIKTGTPAQLEVVLQGVTNESHLIHVLFNGADLGAITFANTDHASHTFAVSASLLHDGDNTVELTSLGGASDISLIDVLRLTYSHSLVADDNVLSFSVKSQQSRRISGFTNANVRVLDITDPSSISELKPLVTAESDGYAAYVEVRQASTLSPHALLAFVGGETRAADSVKGNDPSSWWSQTAGANYVVITTADLKAAVEPLAQMRRSQGMTVAVVDVEDIYDEFSFGHHSPEAIRTFFQNANNTWKQPPHFVLLTGDASYDPKNYFGQGLNDLVPTKLIDTALNETASDDWLTDFNGDGITDLAIGRLPVRTVSDADTMVSKIINYENAAPDPSRGALLVADTHFEASSSLLQNLMPAGMAVQIINRGSTDDPTAHDLVVARINQGPRAANYFGHGSNGIWSAGLLSNADAPALTNANRLSLFTMMTCFNGYFQDPYNDSLSEALLKSNGGAVAVWASTSLTEPAGQNVIGVEFYRLLFGAQAITLGDAARMAKAVTNDADVRRTWTLFGDPASRLR